jgi:hypothetical protein
LALDRKVGSFSTGTGAIGTTVVVSGLGFQPKAIIFWWSGTTSSVNAVTEQDHFHGFGFAVSPTDRRAVTGSSDHAAAGGGTDHGHRADACVIGVGIGGGFNAMLDLQSMDVDGFTLVVDDAFPASRRISYLALGGSDITDAETEQIIMPSATGTVDYTTLGFQPDVVFFISATITANPPGETGDSTVMFGVATGSGQQFVVAGGSNDGSATTSTRTYHQDAECIARMGTALDGVMTGRAEFTTFLVNGYRLNWLEGDSGANTRVHVLALGGTLKAKAGSLLSLTSLAAIATSGVGFLPNTLLLGSGTMAESVQDTGTNDDHRWSVGAADGTTEVVQGIRDHDGVATTDVATALNVDNVYLRLNPTAASIDGSATFTSFDSDGFTLTQTDADPTASFIGWLAMGSAAAFAFSTIVAISGDGAVAAAATTQRFASVSVSADGAVASVTQKNGVVSASVAGDGAISSTAAKDGQQATSASGDGAVAATGTKQAYVLSFVSADGQVTVVSEEGGLAATTVSGDGEVSALGFKSAFTTGSVSDDGQVSVEYSIAAQAHPQVHGDGMVNVEATKKAFSVVSVDGDGFTISQPHAVVSVSGDGAVAVVGQKNFSDQVAVSADGAVVATSHKGGQSTASTAGDGALSSTATKEGESGTSVSGDGETAPTATTARFSDVLSIGGGGAVAVGEEGAQQTAQVSGDGEVVAVGFKAAFGSVTVDGDGLQETFVPPDLYQMELSLDDEGVVGVFTRMTFEFFSP